MFNLFRVYIFWKYYKAKNTKKKERKTLVKPWLKYRRHASGFDNIYMQSWWLMRLNNQYCFVSLFISWLIEQTGCFILYRASSSFHRAINSMISLWVHSLLPLLLFLFDIRLLPEEHKDVEGFTTDAILLTATVVLGFVQYF